MERGNPGNCDTHVPAGSRFGYPGGVIQHACKPLGMKTTFAIAAAGAVAGLLVHLMWGPDPNPTPPEKPAPPVTAKHVIEAEDQRLELFHDCADEWRTCNWESESVRRWGSEDYPLCALKLETCKELLEAMR